MFKVKKYFLVVLLVVCLPLLMSCSNDPSPEAKSDHTETPLNVNIDSIKSGIPYATHRVEEWRDTMVLNYINVGFYGKEQIKNRKGGISYFFYEENVTKKLDADASVDIDMNNNSIVGFSSSYGTPKQLGGSALMLNTENWTIDINEAFDIVEAEIGEDTIYQYANPKVVIDCCETFWEYMIFSEPEAPYADIAITINPINGKATDVHDNREISN
jgi:hypothetical protein